MPFPANYGGVIDVFYKLKHFHQKGIKVYLHCFEYGRKHATELEKYCEKVFYYKRRIGFWNNLSVLPYNVKSRISEALLQNLLSNDFPILFEVLHTCYLMADERLKSRFKIYRHSNIEHDYYNQLSESEKNPLRKLYLKIEARRLKRFEKIITHANLILAVSANDLNYFKEKYPDVKSEYLPSFHSNDKLSIKEGAGDYILYHGNLSVSENYRAALWLIENVFSKINFPVKIAGLNPPEFLIREIKKYKHISLCSNPNAQAMDDLIENAQIHTLYTNQDTGLKLKLLNVLYQGRWVVCNNFMISGTNLNNLDTFFITNSADEFKRFIEKNINSDFKKEYFIEREAFLSTFSNHSNMNKLLNLVS